MFGELVLRFVLGGAIVSLFAVGGEAVTPKTFGGLFGAAPSVAIATLGLGFTTHGASFVAVEATAMIVGAAGFLAYAIACAVAVRRGMRVWLGAILAWTVWALVSFSFFFALRAALRLG